MRRLIVQQWVTVDNIAAEEDGGLSFVSGDPFSETTDEAFKASVMGFIDSVDTMISFGAVPEVLAGSVVGGLGASVAGAGSAIAPVTVSGSAYIAPVTGSTASMPIKPPKRMLPKYQPLSEPVIVTSRVGKPSLTNVSK